MTKLEETLEWHLKQEEKDFHSLRTGLQVLKHNWVRGKESETLEKLKELSKDPEFEFVISLVEKLEYTKDLIDRIEKTIQDY